jgi:hypothetical protein
MILLKKSPKKYLNTFLVANLFSTAQCLGTPSQADKAFDFMPGAGHHYQRGQFTECNFIYVHVLLGNFKV